MENNNVIVVYMGGSCGDFLTSLLDNTDTEIDYKLKRMFIPQERCGFKKPHLFQNDEEKIEYMEKTFLKYKSIPSHDSAWHIRQNHKFIGIKVSNPNTAKWAADRFKNLHRPHVWEEMKNITGTNTVEGYSELLLNYGSTIEKYASTIVDLDDILNGLILEKLPSMGYSLSKGYKELFKQYISCLNTSVNTELIY